MSAADTAAALPPAARPLIAAAKAGKRTPAYLLYGEPLLVGATTQALLDVLVPESKRSLNLEVHEGRSADLAVILDGARMPGFFGGTKVVWIREAPMLVASERRSETAAAMFEAASEGRIDAANSRLLALLAAAGWSQDDFDTRRISEMPKTKVATAFGDDIDADNLAALDDIQAWARAKGARLSAAGDASDQVLTLIESGLPPNVVLLFTATSVDSRKRIVKRLREVGEVLELAMERERSGALSGASAAELIDRVVAAHNKRLAPTARQRLLRLAGSDPWAFTNEVEKLCLSVGDAETITANDVDAAVRDLGDAWIFDLTAALAGRDRRRSLLLLRGLLDQGDHPLRLLATFHSHVKLLLILRECLDGPWRGKWRPGTRPDAMKTLLGALPPEEEKFLAAIHPYRLAINADQAAKLSADRLRRAIFELAGMDIKFKSSRGDPRILLEAFVMHLCQ